MFETENVVKSVCSEGFVCLESKVAKAGQLTTLAEGLQVARPVGRAPHVDRLDR